MASKSPLAAAAAVALILPAGLFMIALVVRTLPLDPLARTAEALVQWYSLRMWTLWVLLLLLPFASLAVSGSALLNGERPRIAFAVPTVVAVVILAVVVLHMAAN